MNLKALTLGAVTAAMLVVPAIAEAAWVGHTTTAVNMRVDAYAGAPKITTLPANATVRVDGEKDGWYFVSYGTARGYVSSNYVTTRMAAAPPPATYYGPAPTYGYVRAPWWDNHYHAWYDGHRWYRNGVWYNSPSGFSFGLNFGG